MASGAVLDLDDPGIGIEAQLAREALLDLGLRRRLHATAEEPIRGARIVEHALRRRPEQLGRAVKPVELDEDGAGLLCPAPAYRRERALGVAAPDIGRDPDRRFEAHRPSAVPRCACGADTTDTGSDALIPAAGRSSLSSHASRGPTPGR